MEIDPHPPGLISRRFFPIDQGRWCMQEEWNLDVPGCPMIRSPWHGQLQGGPIFIRQLEISAKEYAAIAGHAYGQVAPQER